MNGGVVRRFLGQRPIGADGLVEIADGEVLVRANQLELGNVGRLRAQDVRLLQRLFELLALVQDVDEIDAGAGVLWLDHQGGLQQELGLVIGVEGFADLGEESHALDVVAVLLQEIAAEGFSPEIAAFLDQVGDAEQLRGQGAQIVVLVAGEFGGG